MTRLARDTQMSTGASDAPAAAPPATLPAGAPDLAPAPAQAEPEPGPGATSGAAAAAAAAAASATDHHTEAQLTDQHDVTAAYAAGAATAGESAAASESEPDLGSGEPPAKRRRGRPPGPSRSRVGSTSQSDSERSLRSGSADEAAGRPRRGERVDYSGVDPLKSEQGRHAVSHRADRRGGPGRGRAGLRPPRSRSPPSSDGARGRSQSPPPPIGGARGRPLAIDAVGAARGRPVARRDGPPSRQPSPRGEDAAAMLLDMGERAQREPSPTTALVSNALLEMGSIVPGSTRGGVPLGPMPEAAAVATRAMELLTGIEASAAADASDASRQQMQLALTREAVDTLREQRDADRTRIAELQDRIRDLERALSKYKADLGLLKSSYARTKSAVERRRRTPRLFDDQENVGAFAPRFGGRQRNAVPLFASQDDESNGLSKQQLTHISNELVGLIVMKSDGNRTDGKAILQAFINCGPVKNLLESILTDDSPTDYAGQTRQMVSDFQTMERLKVTVGILKDSTSCNECWIAYQAILTGLAVEKSHDNFEAEQKVLLKRLNLVSRKGLDGGSDRREALLRAAFGTEDDCETVADPDVEMMWFRDRRKEKRTSFRKKHAQIVKMTMEFAQL